MPNNQPTNNPANPSNTKQGDAPITPMVKEAPKSPKKAPLKKKKHKDKLSTKSAMLHTFKQDVEGLVRNRDISMVKVMSAESDKPLKEGSLVVNTAQDGGQKATQTKFMLIASVLMIVLGIIALVVAYSAYQVQQQAATQDRSQVLQDDAMLFVEHRARLNVTDRLPRETLTELTKILVDSQATLGSITQVILEWSAWNDAAEAKTTFTITQADFIDLLGLDFSDQFIRLLGGPYEYMLGVHVADRNTPFIILTTHSHEHAFAEMLRWENAAEVQLSPLFNTNGDGSSKRTIEDIVVQNIDARAVRDGSRNLKLLYAFLDYDTILITNNIHTLTEISRRYKVRKASGTADVPTGFIK